MCSEIDARTRENPEAAMLHHDANQLYNQFYTGNWHVYEPRSWPANELLRHIDAEAHQAFWHNDDAPVAEPKPEAQTFDTEAHRAFMRSLG